MDFSHEMSILTIFLMYTNSITNTNTNYKLLIQIVQFQVANTRWPITFSVSKLLHMEQKCFGSKSDSLHQVHFNFKGRI